MSPRAASREPGAGGLGVPGAGLSGDEVQALGGSRPETGEAEAARVPAVGVFPDPSAKLVGVVPAPLAQTLDRTQVMG